MQSFLTRVRAGEPVEFDATMAIIDRHYSYQPTAFVNGIGEQRVVNGAGDNQGSCRILAFARLHQLTEAQTLALFGTYYRDEVLNDPEGQGHANIRAFMRHGWAGVRFDGQVLTPVESSGG